MGSILNKLFGKREKPVNFSKQAEDFLKSVKTVHTQKDFNLEIKEKFIPMIEGLIAKEKKHIKDLSNKLGEFKNPKDISMVQGFLDTSSFMLEHYMLKLKEYQDYVKD